MASNRKHNLFEEARDAITGYTLVILQIICFILTLMVIVAVVRFVVGLSLSANTSTAAQTTIIEPPATTQAR